MDVLELGEMKNFNVDHQSFAESEPEASLSFSLS